MTFKEVLSTVPVALSVMVKIQNPSLSSRKNVLLPKENTLLELLLNYVPDKVFIDNNLSSYFYI